MLADAARLAGMSALKERLRADLTAAMKARDELRTSTLRMALTSVSTAEVAGSAARDLDDDEILAVLTKEAKKRRESVEAYESAGRKDLAERELAEAAVLADYLPSPLSAEEVRDLVAAAIVETDASGARAMGSVMKVVQPRTAGRADGRAVADEVRRQLSGR
jgi:uncharacterized protein YqeY